MRGEGGGEVVGGEQVKRRGGCYVRLVIYNL